MISRIYKYLSTPYGLLQEGMYEADYIAADYIE